MSIEATNFVRELESVTAWEKLVLFCVASHCNHKTGRCTASMSTIAKECRLASRQAASRIVNRLIGGPLKAVVSSKGRHTSVLAINYDYTDNRIPADADDESPTASPEVQLDESNRIPGSAVNRIPEASNRIPDALQPHPGGCRKGFKERKNTKVKSFKGQTEKQIAKPQTNVSVLSPAARLSDLTPEQIEVELQDTKRIFVAMGRLQEWDRLSRERKLQMIEEARAAKARMAREQEFRQRMFAR